jgi:aspartate aminotransferase-like enzyme
MRSLGLSLFADEQYASNTVTVVKTPQGMDVRRLLSILRQDYQMVRAGGYPSLADSIFRIGHLGWVTTDDIQEVVSALKKALPRALAA